MDFLNKTAISTKVHEVLHAMGFHEIDGQFESGFNTLSIKSCNEIWYFSSVKSILSFILLFIFFIRISGLL